MWRCPSFLLVLTSFLWLTLPSDPANSLMSAPIPPVKLAQGEGDLLGTPTATPRSNQPEPSILRIGDSGSAVKQLQTQLKQLGHYQGEIDGEYGSSTRLAVAQFQAANGLNSDGIVGSQTRMQIEAKIQAVAAISTSEPQPKNSSQQNKSRERGTLWWMFAGMGVLGCGGAVTFTVRRFLPKKPQQDPTVIIPDEVTSITQGMGMGNSGNLWQVAAEGVSFQKITPEVTTCKPSQTVQPSQRIHAKDGKKLNQNNQESKIKTSSQLLLTPKTNPTSPPENSQPEEISIQIDKDDRTSPSEPAHYITASHNRTNLPLKDDDDIIDNREQTYIQTDGGNYTIDNQEQTYIQTDGGNYTIDDQEQTYIQTDYGDENPVPEHEQTFFQIHETPAEFEPWAYNSSDRTIIEEGISSTQNISPEISGQIAKISIVDELINDLQSCDPKQRRKAIWDLGQQGDSRAIQPLVDSLIDADSQQRSLILGALSEIGTRTLKPMNRALAISLQDESPQVRQNAIRDLTRLYDMMAQLSQILCHATADPDSNVQATARYALSQFNRLRTLANGETNGNPSQPIADQDK